QAVRCRHGRAARKDAQPRVVRLLVCGLCLSGWGYRDQGIQRQGPGNPERLHLSHRWHRQAGSSDPGQVAILDERLWRGVLQHARQGRIRGHPRDAGQQSSPHLQQLHQFITNENWMNQKISDPYAPAIQQIAQRFKAVMESNLPISIAQAERQVHNVTPAEQKALSIAAFAGINKAPAYVSTPAPIEQIYRVSAILGGQETYSSNQLYQAENRANLRDLF